MWECTDSGDILILMLALQNTASLLKQPKHFNHVIKKKKNYHLLYFQQVNHKMTILAQQI